MLLELFWRGGWVMWPILATSVVALAASLNRVLYVWRTRGDEGALLEGVLRHLEGGTLEEARALCARSQVATAPVLLEGLAAFKEPEQELERRLEQSGARALQAAEAGLPVLGTALALLPMLGFLGTISGLIASFNVWAAAGADVGIEQLSTGIASAMITTGAGLVGAIPYTVAYNVFANHAAKVARSLNSATSELLGRRRARSGPSLALVRQVGEGG